MLDQPFLSVIIPSFNEKTNFNKGCMSKVNKYLVNYPKKYEVILVDDGSEDDTVALLEEFIFGKKNWNLIKRPHKGKAGTIAAGIDKARGRYILFTDFDQATPLNEVEKLIPFMNKGYDIVIGSREVKGSKREKEPLYRHLMGKTFNLVVQIIALPGIHDTQCGFKLLKAEVAKKLFSELKVYKEKSANRPFTGAFDVELLFLAQKKGFKIAEVPVHWQHYETKRVDPIRDSIQMFFDVLKIRFSDLLGIYDKD